MEINVCAFRGCYWIQWIIKMDRNVCELDYSKLVDETGNSWRGEIENRHNEHFVHHHFLFMEQEVGCDYLVTIFIEILFSYLYFLEEYKQTCFIRKMQSESSTLKAYKFNTGETNFPNWADWIAIYAVTVFNFTVLFPCIMAFVCWAVSGFKCHTSHPHYDKCIFRTHPRSLLFSGINDTFIMWHCFMHVSLVI